MTRRVSRSGEAKAGSATPIATAELAASEEVSPGFKLSEIGPVPEEWRVMQLSEVLEQHTRKERVRPERSYTRLGVRWYAQGPFVKDSTRGSEIKGMNLYEVEEGDFIYNRLFAWKGSFGVVPASMRGCWVSNEFPLFSVRDDIADSEFLWRWFSLPGVWRYIEHKSAGTTRVSRLRFREEDLLQLAIPVPPLPEQRAIARVLRTVQRAREATQAVIQATRALKQSMMRHLFTYGPVPVDEADKVKLKETEIGMMPEHWELPRLEDIAETRSGGTPSRQKSEFYGGPVPWVKSGELADSMVLSTEETITDEGVAASNAKVMPRGTLLLAMYGATAGKVGILGMEAATNQAVCAVVPDSSSATPEYLFFALASRRVALLGERYGGAQPNLSQTVIKRFRVPLPSLREQQPMAKCCSALEVKLVAEQSRKQALDSLFKSLLHSLMTGKVRVPLAEMQLEEVPA